MMVYAECSWCTQEGHLNSNGESNKDHLQKELPESSLEKKHNRVINTVKQWQFSLFLSIFPLMEYLSFKKLSPKK